jgi:hypothetical protein
MTSNPPDQLLPESHPIPYLGPLPLCPMLAAVNKSPSNSAHRFVVNTFGFNAEINSGSGINALEAHPFSPICLIGYC